MPLQNEHEMEAGLIARNEPASQSVVRLPMRGTASAAVRAAQQTTLTGVVNNVRQAAAKIITAQSKSACDRNSMAQAACRNIR